MAGKERGNNKTLYSTKKYKETIPSPRVFTYFNVTQLHIFFLKYMLPAIQ